MEQGERSTRGQSIPVPNNPDSSAPPMSAVCSPKVPHQVNRQVCRDTAYATMNMERAVVNFHVGVLCNPVWLSRRKRMQEGKHVSALEKLVKAGESAGASCFLFGLKDMNFQSREVKGYRLVNSQWSPALFPLPDVIYDQVISRKLERSPEYKERHAELEKVYGPRLFNHGFFDKWQVHQWLLADSRIRKHVPLTIRFSHVNEAVKFVKKFPATFLKPLHGSLGLGIMRLNQQTDGSVTYDIKRVKQGPLHGKSVNVEEAIRGFRARMGARPYVLQQGIPLATYRNRPFDVRILLQRDGRGVWKRTKMFARVARSGDFTSNLSSGGEALPVNAVLEAMRISLERSQRTLQTIRRVSRIVTGVIEEQSGTTFGELGIDIGIDEQGGVWVIEVNSKPWKSPVTEKGRQDLVDLAFARPMQYAIWLAEHK